MDSTQIPFDTKWEFLPIYGRRASQFSLIYGPRTFEKVSSNFVDGLNKKSCALISSACVCMCEGRMDSFIQWMSQHALANMHVPCHESWHTYAYVTVWIGRADAASIIIDYEYMNVSRYEWVMCDVSRTLVGGSYVSLTLRDGSYVMTNEY